MKPVNDEVLDIMTEEELERIRQIDEEEEAKQAKQEALATLRVEQHGVPFDANEPAQNNMTSVLAVANWQFNKNIAGALSGIAELPGTDEVTKAMLEGLAQIFDGLYDLTYKTKIGWKGADDKPHTVQAETIAKALYEAMQMKAQIIGVSNVKK